MSETVTYSVPAIHCEHCAMSIREEVSEVEGVETVAVDLDSKVVTVTRPRAGRRGAARRDRGSRVRGGVTATADTTRNEVRLDLEGMTCASCVARIERKLNKLEGVEATVNFATEQATVRCDPSVTVDELVSARRGSGISRAPGRGARAATITTTSRSPCFGGGSPSRIALTVPLVLLAMVPPLQFSGWEWVALALATPVVFWSGHRLPPRRAAERTASRGDDGHAHLDRHARRLGLVDGRTRRRARRGHVLRGRRGHHDADPARPLPRGAGEEPLVARRSARCSSSAPRKRACSATATSCSSRSRRSCRRPVRRATRREDRDGRRSSRRASRRSTSRC